MILLPHNTKGVIFHAKNIAGVFKNFPRFFFLPFLLAFLFLTLTACQFEDSSLREDTTTFSKIPEQYLSKIQISDIKQIERISITGGKDSPTSQNLSKEEISAFTDWMHQLRFHEEISRKEALSFRCGHLLPYFLLGRKQINDQPWGNYADK